MWVFYNEILGLKDCGIFVSMCVDQVVVYFL